MRTKDLVESSLQSLNRTRARSALTMLGIVIGIMSVILMLSVGEAAQRYILGQISSFGSDILTVQNGPKETSGQPSLFIKQTLTMQDLRRLRSLTWVTAASGRYSSSEQLAVNGLTDNVTIVGTTPEELSFQDVSVAQGNFFDSTSVDGHAREAVIGYQIANDAFGVDNPIGKDIKVDDQSFHIIGVMATSRSRPRSICTIRHICKTSA